MSDDIYIDKITEELKAIGILPLSENPINHNQEIYDNDIKIEGEIQSKESLETTSVGLQALCSVNNFSGNMEFGILGEQKKKILGQNGIDFKPEVLNYIIGPQTSLLLPIVDDEEPGLVSRIMGNIRSFFTGW